jgi:hypothetical protein
MSQETNLDMSNEIVSKHHFEKGNNSNCFFFEILSENADPLPSRAHIFHNSVFGKRRIIAELGVALLEELKIAVFLRTVALVINFLIPYNFIYLFI